MINLLNNKNMKKQSINNRFLCLGLGLMMLSGATTIYAQEENEAADTTTAVVRKTAKVLPVYEMKEVSGVVYDAATKLPIDGANVQAYGFNRFTVMTNEKGEYTLKVPVFVNSL